MSTAALNPAEGEARPDGGAGLAELNRILRAQVRRQQEERQPLGRLRGFLAPQLAELIGSSGEDLLLDSHRRELTVVSCGLAGFTAFAETAEPEDVMDVLREYHAAMGELIVGFQGILDHFAGDGLTVLLNGLLPCSNAAHAIGMAVAMRQRVAELAQAWRRHGYQLDFRAGVAQGYATLGRLGFPGRFEYRAIGPVTNLAFRLCDAAQPGQIVLCERVYMAVEEQVEAQPAARLVIQGSVRAAASFNVLGF